MYTILNLKFPTDMFSSSFILILLWRPGFSYICGSFLWISPYLYFQLEWIVFTFLDIFWSHIHDLFKNKLSICVHSWCVDRNCLSYCMHTEYTLEILLNIVYSHDVSSQMLFICCTWTSKLCFKLNKISQYLHCKSFLASSPNKSDILEGILFHLN